MADSTKKLGLAGLIAIVFGSMIGGGIFNIAQNMANGAGLGATIISWLITGVGILFLVYVFKILADARPDLNAGIYQYAKEGYGNYVGFNIAWGYWLCVATGNVAYAVMLSQAFGAFFPELLKDWPIVIFGSAFIWLMFFIVALGVKAASALNTIVTIVKFASLVLIVVILLIFFKFKTLNFDFWGNMPEIGSLSSQIKSTMLVTLWCFIGIEGAVMMSSQAKKSTDVGKAGVIGFLAALIMYALISILCYGIMHQPELSKLEDPSVAYVLKEAVGIWAYYFVVISVIISLLGGWVAWTLVCAQVPMTAAQVKILPNQFLKLNKKGTPVFGLFISSLFMQLFMVLVALAPSIYLAAVDLTSIMVLPAYLFCGLYLFKASIVKNQLGPQYNNKRIKYRIMGCIASLYCFWLLYSGGLLLFLISSIFYLPGIYFFYLARKQNKEKGESIFKNYEKIIAICLLIAAIVSIYLICIGKAHL